MSGDYKVLVRLLVESNEGAVLGAFSKHLLGVQGDVDKLTSKIRGLHDILKGGIQVVGAYEIGKELGHIVDKGNEIVRIQKNMRDAGVSQLDIAKATTAAFEATGKVINVNAAQALELANNFRGIFGSQKEATSFVPQAAEYLGYLQAIRGDKGGDWAKQSLTEVESSFKSGELAGKINPDEMMKHLEALAAMRQAFGDQVDINRYLTAQRRAGIAFRNMDDDYRYGIFAPLVQEMGQTAGVQAMTAFQKFGAGVHWSGYNVQAARELGIIDNNYVNGEGLPSKITDQKAIMGYQEFAQNPFKWMQDVLKPALERQLDKEALKNPSLNDPVQRQLRETGILQRITGDRSSANYLTELLTQEPKWLKDSAVFFDSFKALQAHGFMSYINGGTDHDLDDHGFHGGRDRMGTNVAPSWDAQVQGFTAQWNSLMQALGAPSVGTAATMLQSVNNAISGLASAAASHPNAAKSIGDVTIAVTGLLAALGIGNIAKGGARMLFGGDGAFGLRGAATQLSGAAAALDGAATRLGAGGAAGVAGTTVGANKSPGTIAKGLKAIPWIGFLAALGDIQGGFEKDAIDAVGGDMSKVPWWVKANHAWRGDNIDPFHNTPMPASDLERREYADQMAMKRISGNLGPGRSPTGSAMPPGASNVSATLQAQVSPTMNFTATIDGKKVADEVYHLIMPLIEKAMTAAANSMMSGMHNDIGSHASPGTVGAHQ